MSARRRDAPFSGVGLVDPEPAVLEAPPEPEAEEPEPPEEFPPETFLLADDAPKDGTLLQVKYDPDVPDEQAVYAVWRSTMAFIKEDRRWRRIGYWADPVTKRQLPGEPIVYRLASAAPILGLIA